MNILPEENLPWQEADDYAPWRLPPSEQVLDAFTLSIRRFRSGGYEALGRLVDVRTACGIGPESFPRPPSKFDDMQQAPRVREESLERPEESIQRSRRRAKTTVRQHIKDMGGNRLCTLTVRQNEYLGYLSPDDWSQVFARWRRLVRRAGLLADYVAVLEPHKRGLEFLQAGGCDLSGSTPWGIPLHLHFVARSAFKMPIHFMRKCWLAVLREIGHDGNVDVQFMRSRLGDDDVIGRVASYASKYIAKGWGDYERFNKKRFWVAGEPLLPKDRLWLRARNLNEALREFQQRFSVSAYMMGDRHTLFLFPDSVGFWVNVRPSELATPPPF